MNAIDLKGRVAVITDPSSDSGARAVLERILLRLGQGPAMQRGEGVAHLRRTGGHARGAASAGSDQGNRYGSEPRYHDIDVTTFACDLLVPV